MIVVYLLPLENQGQQLTLSEEGSVLQILTAFTEQYEFRFQFVHQTLPWLELYEGARPITKQRQT